MPPSIPAPKARLDVVYLSCQLVTSGLLLAFIIGSLLFTGGQVTPDEGAKWAALWSWPVFPVPPWVTIVPAALGALVVVPVALTTIRSVHTPLVGRWGQTIPALGGAFLFDQLFPVAPGTALFWSHAFAMMLSGFSFAVLTAAVLVLLARERRTQDSAETGPAAMVSTGRVVAAGLMALACAAVFVLFAWGSIQGWQGIASAANGAGSRWEVSDPPSVSDAMFLTLTAAVWLVLTAVVALFVLRQVAGHRQSRAEAGPS